MADIFKEVMHFTMNEEVGPFWKTGGYTDDPDDPGGETKWGRAARYNPGVDIKNLTYEDAVEMYRTDEWAKILGDRLHPAIAWCVFDMSVNAGCSRGIKLLQMIVGAHPDGRNGPKTIAATEQHDPVWVVREYTRIRIDYYVSRVWNKRTKTWVNMKKIKYVSGWCARAANCQAAILLRFFGK